MMAEESSDCYDCQIEIDKSGYPLLTLCDKHGAADAMYEALEFAKAEVVAITQCDEAWEPYGIALMIRDRAAAALALADGPDA